MIDPEKRDRIKREKQSILKRDMAKEIGGREVTDEEAEYIICGELKDMDKDEYLVDGAVLSCTSAVWEDFSLSSGKVHIEGAEKKTKDDRPTGILRVWENPLTESVTESGSESHHYATVADAVKFQNITPFLCNCSERASSEQEQKIKDNMDECRKHGVCQYLMDLEEEWENYDFGIAYEPFFNLGVEPGLGAANFLGSPIIISEAEKKAGIIKTSVLFCKHGGFIYPISSGQKKNALEELDQSDPESIKQYMWNFFRDAGFSEVAVAGILGNVYVESGGFDREAKGCGELYYGFFQYGGKRKQMFLAASEEWEKEHGVLEGEGWKDVRFQCEYALEDYLHGHYDNDNDRIEKGWADRGVFRADGSLLESSKELFENTTDVEDAALAWGVSYEKCVNPGTWLDIEEAKNKVAPELQMQKERVDAAETIYRELKE